MDKKQIDELFDYYNNNNIEKIYEFLDVDLENLTNEEKTMLIDNKDKAYRTIMKKIVLGGFILSFAVVNSANALQYNNGRHAFRFDASGSAGVIEPEFKDTLFLGDFEVGAKYNYAVARGQTLGLVYEYDSESLDDHDFAHDAFALWEIQDIGRIEVGYTSSVARKLSVESQMLADCA
jgi:hypothetical protein